MGLIDQHVCNVQGATKCELQGICRSVWIMWHLYPTDPRITKWTLILPVYNELPTWLVLNFPFFIFGLSMTGYSFGCSGQEVIAMVHEVRNLFDEYTLTLDFAYVA